MSTRRAAKKAVSDIGSPPRSAGKVVPLPTREGLRPSPQPEGPLARRAPPSSGDRERPAQALGRGAHFARLTRKIDDARYEAQVIGGDRVEVAIAPEVDLDLADRCLADQDIVLVGALGAEIVLFGALRTRERRPEEVVIEAPRRLVLRAGKSKVILSADGRIKLSGDDVTVDAPREVRLASAKVEIP